MDLPFHPDRSSTQRTGQCHIVNDQDTRSRRRPRLIELPDSEPRRGSSGCGKALNCNFGRSARNRKSLTFAPSTSAAAVQLVPRCRSPVVVGSHTNVRACALCELRMMSAQHRTTPLWISWALFSESQPMWLSDGLPASCTDSSNRRVCAAAGNRSSIAPT